MFAAQLANLVADHRDEVIASWPGHHTWVLPDDFYPAEVRGQRRTLACRVPDHAQARELCAGFAAPLVSTSANLSGKPGIVSAAQAHAQFAGVVDFVLPGEVGAAGKASTIHGLDRTILR